MPLFPNNTQVPITNFDPFPQPTFAQEWQFSVPTPLQYFFFLGSGVTFDPVVLDITLRDYPAILGNTYVSYKVYSIQSILQSSGTNPNAFTVVSNVPELGETFTSSTREYQETITINDPQDNAPALIDGNVNNIQRGFRITGVRSTGQEDVLDERFFSLSIIYVRGNAIYFNKNRYDIAHEIGTALPDPISVDVLANQSYFLVIHPDFEISGVDLPSPINTPEGLRYNFTEPYTFTLSPKISIENQPNVFRENVPIVTARLDNDPLAFFNILEGNIFAATTLEYLFTPQQFNFLLIKDELEPTPQVLEIFGSGPWQLSAQSWITLDAQEGNGPQEINVGVINPDAFPQLGLYLGKIDILANNIAYEVPVTLLVVEKYMLNLEQNEVNFTLDNWRFSEVYSNPQQGRFAQANLTISQIGYPNATQLPNTYDFKLDFFNNKSKIHLGEIVHRALPDLSAQDVSNLLYNKLTTLDNSSSLVQFYKPSLVDVLLQRYNEEDLFTPIDEQLYRLVRFVKGRRPKFLNKVAILDYETITTKVNKESFQLVNFIASSDVRIQVFRNGEEQSSQIIPINIERLYGFPIYFSAYSVADLIEVKLSNASTLGQNLSKKFRIYPEGKQFQTLIFQDEYGVTKIMDACGEFSVESDYEFLTSTLFENLVEYFKNEKTKKQATFSINTGYIPRSNQHLIEQMKFSPYVWLFASEAYKLIELTMQSSKMLHYDSDKDLYDYALTFKINPTNDLQDITFGLRN